MTNPNTKIHPADTVALKQQLLKALHSCALSPAQMHNVACSVGLQHSNLGKSGLKKISKEIFARLNSLEDIQRLICAAYITAPEAFEYYLEQYVVQSDRKDIIPLTDFTPNQRPYSSRYFAWFKTLPYFKISFSTTKIYTVSHKVVYTALVIFLSFIIARFLQWSPLQKSLYQSGKSMLGVVQASWSSLSSWDAFEEKCDSDNLCILLAELKEPLPDNHITLQANVQSMIEAALGGKEYKIIRVNTSSRQEAERLVEQYGALVAIGGGFLDSSPDKQGKVQIWSAWNNELALIDRSGIRPTRILPNAEISSFVQDNFECTACSDMSNNLGAHIQYIALAAAGLRSYLQGYGNEAKGYFYQALQVAPLINEPASLGSMKKGTQKREQLFYYYIGKSFALDGDYPSSITCLQAALIYQSSTDGLAIQDMRRDACDEVIKNPAKSSHFNNSPFFDYSMVDIVEADPAIFLSLAQVYMYWLREHGHLHSEELLELAENSIDAQSNSGNLDILLPKRLFNQGTIYTLRSDLAPLDQKEHFYQEAIDKYEASSFSTLYKYESYIQLARLYRSLGNLTGQLTYYIQAEESINSAEELNPEFIWSHRERILLYAKWMSVLSDKPQMEKLGGRLQQTQAYLEHSFSDQIYTYVTLAEKCIILDDKLCSLDAVERGLEQFTYSGWYLSFSLRIYWHWSAVVSIDEYNELLQKSLERYEIAKGLRPKDPALPAQIGYFYAKNCQLEDAQIYFDLAQQLAFPQYISAAYSGELGTTCNSQEVQRLLHPQSSPEANARS